MEIVLKMRFASVGKLAHRNHEGTLDNDQFYDLPMNRHVGKRMLSRLKRNAMPSDELLVIHFTQDDLSTKRHVGCPSMHKGYCVMDPYKLLVNM